MMGVSHPVQYLLGHWAGWLEWGAGGVALWFVVHWIASPLLRFRDARRHAIEAIQEHGTSYLADTLESVYAARSSLNTAARQMFFYAQGGPFIVRWYCRLRGYDLQTAGRVLNGLVGSIGSLSLPEYQCDAARVCLGADRMIPAAKRRAIRAALYKDLARDSKDKSPTRAS